MLKKFCYILCSLLFATLTFNATAATCYIINKSKTAAITKFTYLDDGSPVPGFPARIGPGEIYKFEVTFTYPKTTPIFMGDDNGNGCYFSFITTDTGKNTMIGGGIGIGKLIEPGCQIGNRQKMLAINIQ